METFVGRHLAAGDTLAEVVQTSTVSVDVAVPESDALLLRSGENASVKLESFPLHTFRGDVSVVAPQGQVVSDKRFFVARVNVGNADGLIRPGMQGQSKISVGWHPAGYLFFRGPAMWIWSKLWSWFGW
jgi:multidrug efflux pump subunit AcrA (membrane-fusion protein)